MKTFNDLIKLILLGVFVFVVTQVFSYFCFQMIGSSSDASVGYGAPINFYTVSCGFRIPTFDPAMDIPCEHGPFVNKFLFDLAICLILWFVFRLIAIKTSIDGSAKLRWYEWLVFAPVYLLSVHSFLVSVYLFSIISVIFAPIVVFLIWWIFLKIVRSKTLNQVVRILLASGLMILVGCLLFLALGYLY